MNRREFLAALALLGCEEEELTVKKSTKILHAFLSGGFNLAQYMDLINLQSVNQSQFTLTGSSIDSWNDGISAWTQGTGTAKPTLTGGVPLFDGGDKLVRSATNNPTVYSLYILFKNTGALTKMIMGSSSGSDYLLHDSSYRVTMNVGGVAKSTLISGLGSSATGNRYSIFAIRRNGNTIAASVNDRSLYETTNTFAGQAQLLDVLMSYAGAGFFMTGGVKAVCMSSQNLSDSVHAQVINKLYSDYSMSSDATAMTIFGFGDSNTAGQGATSYLIALSAGMSLAHCNLGISGSRLTAFTATSGIARYASQLNSRPYTDKVVIQYGTNDILGGVSQSDYETALNTVVGGLITAGWSAAKICICSPPYQQSGANAAALALYNTSCSTVATTYGTKYFDLYTDIKDNGGDTLLADAVHLNASGQTRWQNGVAATGL